MHESRDEQELYETRLRRRLEILKKQIEAGKFKVQEGLNLIDSLKKVKYAADGSIDLSTVDSSVRAAALAVEHLHDRDEMTRRIPLLDIQGSYFHVLDVNFGEFYKIMVEKGVTPHDIATFYAQSEERVASLDKILPEFLELLKEFWSSMEEVTLYHLQNITKYTKGVFGGDLFPSNSENIASKCSIYIDTLILPCPFIRSLTMFNHWTPKQRTYYCIKHALNVLKYKNLALEPIYPPILAIYPDRASFDNREKEFFTKLGENDAIIHGSKIFGRSFTSFQEMMEFADELKTVEQVEARIVDRERVLFDVDFKGSLSEQINKSMLDNIEIMKKLSPGLLVASLSMGRMAVSNELIFKSTQLNGVPIIDAPTSWKYFNWKLEYDSEQASKSLGTVDLHIYRALQSMSEFETRWIGKIPPEALIELRRSGATEEIRQMLSRGITGIIEIDPLNFKASTDQVFDNFHDAMAKHQRAIDELSQAKWKFAKDGISSWLVNGTVAVAAAATGQPIWALAPLIAAALLPGPKLLEIPSTILDFAQQSNILKRSPMGMLFDYQDN
ncbi:hypothetical protein [Geothrix mesophila]|uniref:hypothetical protein n=1 Tax=Geothrix mesophila TaxID=2922723 RepID=UPI001FADA585|nr:hypothetical protein [Geothrix sp. SG198]